MKAGIITQNMRVIISDLYLFNFLAMQIRPLGNRVLVKMQQEEETTTFGLVLPDTVDKDKKVYGVIESLGNGEEIAKLGLKVGDKVVTPKWGEGVEEIKLGRGKEQTEYRVVMHDKILAVVE
jgi:chaperonin GroES